MSEAPRATTEDCEPRLCSGCGILESARRASCESCEASYPAAPLRALPQPGSGFWVAVRATFRCSACRFDSPLNHFELGEGVVCTHCGIEQRFESSSWRELVELAHRVGDLGAGGAEGRFPDPQLRLGAPLFPELGDRTSWVVEGPYRASPGNPLCPRCQAPWRVDSASKQGIEVTCSGCQERRSYELPESARRLGGLAGVLADEHQAGGREVTFEESTGVVVLRCPNCAAPLEGVSQGDGVFVCSYCDVPCRISARSHARAGHRDTPAKTWWLYFDSPSAERRKLLNQARQEAARAAKARDRAEQRARSLAGQAQAPAGKRRDKKPRAKERQAELRALKPLLWTMAAVPLVALLVYFQPFASKPRGEEKEKAGQVDSSAAVAALQRFSFTLSPSETGALFGVAGEAEMTLELDKSGLVGKVDIGRGGRGGPSRSITVEGGAQLDLDAALGRLREVAPHRLKQKPNSSEINIAKSLLRFNPRVLGQIHGRVEVMTWEKDERRAVELADAFWAVARYALFGSPKPGDAALRIVNGPPLSSAVALDLAVPIESAAKAFQTAFAQGSCQTVTNLATSQTRLVCTVEIDHPLLSSLQLAWPNSEKSMPVGATLAFASTTGDGKSRAAVSTCIDAALGPGADVVVDHASGQSERVWPLDAGSRAVADAYSARLESVEGQDPIKPPGWAGRFAAWLKALDACGR